jgi:methyl-accepting chemotaxis protein
MFSRLALRTKLALLLGLSALAVVVSIASGAAILRDRMTVDRVDKLRAVVQSAMAIASGLETQVVAKTMTRDQAIDRLREVVHMIRFDGGAGYLAISSSDGVGIINGADPSREGKRATTVDDKGKSFSSLSAAALRDSDEGTIAYSFPKPGQTRPQPKVAYLARFARHGRRCSSPEHIPTTWTRRSGSH